MKEGDRVQFSDKGVLYLSAIEGLKGREIDKLNEKGFTLQDGRLEPFSGHKRFNLRGDKFAEIMMRNRCISTENWGESMLKVKRK